MDTKELQKILALNGDRPAEVRVVVAQPSVGAVASSKVASAAFGFDWEHGKFLIRTEDALVPKPKEMAAFQAALELLFHLASKQQKKETYEVREAKRALKKAGYSIEDIEKYGALVARMGQLK